MYSSVFSKIKLHTKCFTAYMTRIAPLVFDTAIAEFVFDEFDRTSTCFSTRGTNERSCSGVHALVLLRVVQISTCLVTCVRNIRVVAAFVFVEIAGRGECFCAYVAKVTVCAKVNTFVVLQMLQVRICSVAHIADVRFHGRSTVAAFVTVAFAGCSKCFCTCVTDVEF